MPSVLVTGASGFVGQAVCRRFLASGWTVFGTVNRTPLKEATVRPLPLGNIADVSDWGPLLRDIDVVVHAAAHVHVMGRSAQATAEFRRVNTEATGNLARTTAMAGIRHFIYLSSVKVLGEASGTKPLCDFDQPDPQGPYARSKYEAEKTLNDVARLGTMKVTVLRPPLVYGAGVKANFLALLGLADSSWPLPFSAARNRRSFVYVGNLADACVRAAAIGAPAGTWLISDGVPLSTAQLLTKLRDLMGRPRRLVPVPNALIRSMGWVPGLRNPVHRLFGSLEVDSSRFEQAFDWTPPCSLDIALAETIAWYQNRGDS